MGTRRLMTNVLKKVLKTNFRYVPGIDSLDEGQLDEHGYYKGYPCPHHHHIRDKQNHWCYHCVVKILSNTCGFNTNFLHPYYNHKYEQLWKNIEVGDLDECWEIDLPGSKSPKRIGFPSYRSRFTGRAIENVTPHKVIYQCAWGDIGAMTVSRACGNPWCANPLHLVSSWNIGLPPASITPFIRTFEPTHVMALIKAKKEGREQELIQRYHKQVIRNPLCAKDAPYYDEG